MDVTPGLRLIEKEGAAIFEPVPAHEGSADLSDGLRWDLAMKRRGLAMDLAGLLPYESHQKWHDLIRKTFMSTPRPGFMKPDWLQLRTADEELFMRVASSCMGTAKTKPGEAKTNFQTYWDQEIAAGG